MYEELRGSVGSIIPCILCVYIFKDTKKKTFIFIAFYCHGVMPTKTDVFRYNDLFNR